MSNPQPPDDPFAPKPEPPAEGPALVRRCGRRRHLGGARGGTPQGGLVHRVRGGFDVLVHHARSSVVRVCHHPRGRDLRQEPSDGSVPRVRSSQSERSSGAPAGAGATS